MNALSTQAALRGMLYQMDRLDVVTDNLANHSMPGYKKTLTAQTSFDAMMRSAAESGSPFDGRSQAAERVTDHSAGPLRVTGNPLDFAIAGDGFFVVEQDGESFYTRNGRFQLDPTGAIVTAGGFSVLGSDGPLRIPENADLSQLTVDADGALRSGEQVWGSVRLASFADPNVLRRVGPGLFAAPPDIEPEPPASGRATNRAVEGSNTTVFEEMAEMIAATRAFEIGQRMLKQLDQAQEATIRQLSM